MADSTGTQADMLVRIKSSLPARWFSDSSPNLDVVLGGLAALWSLLYGLVKTVRLQGRIATASGIFLDFAAADYFGNRLTRRAGEADGAFSSRIRANLLAPRATRSALAAALLRLTGRAANIFEPMNPSDTGGYNTGTLGYNVVGGYGSMALPYQVFVTAYRPNATPISNAGGYNSGPGGYNTAPLFYIDASENSGSLNDADIYATIADVLPANAIAWTKLSD